MLKLKTKRQYLYSYSRDGRRKQSVTTCPLYEHPLFSATTQNNASNDATTMPPTRNFVDGNPSREGRVLDEDGSRMLRVSAVLEVRWWDRIGHLYQRDRENTLTSFK